MTLINSKLHRRQFLRTALATAGGIAALPALRGLGPLTVNGRVYAAPGKGGYGPLIPTADERDGGVRMALPEGFKYRSFSVAGDTMSDGNLVPLAHDGMGVFNTDGRFRLVRNHKDRNSAGSGTVAVDGNAYDRKGGGTTTLVVNPFTRELERDFISLSGTTVNCAGGITPWGSWITSEETNVGPSAGGWTKQHGYNFDVGVGRRHSACCATTCHGSVFSRGGRRRSQDVDCLRDGRQRLHQWFLPVPSGDTWGVGRWGHARNARNRRPAQGRHPKWTDCGRGAARHLGANRESEPRGHQLDSGIQPRKPSRRCSVRSTRRLLDGNGAMYFDATSGGNAGVGQIWEFRPEGDGGSLTLIFESPAPPCWMRRTTSPCHPRDRSCSARTATAISTCAASRSMVRSSTSL